jgi:tryptophan synthase beta chain
VILFNLSGHGYFDMAAYDQYLAGELIDVEYEPISAAGPSSAGVGEEAAVA